MDWYLWALIGFAINWVGMFAFSWAYCGILLWAGDLRLEGWVKWRGWFPVARFRLISTKSWFARAWQNWYGHALLGCMIHRDEKGEFDNEFVEEVIVHELRHNVQQLILGLVFYLAYGVASLVALIRGKNGYLDNWFEVDARAAASAWVNAGRKRIFNFGKRR